MRILILSFILIFAMATSVFSAAVAVGPPAKEDEDALYPGKSNVFVVYEKVALFEKDGVAIGTCRRRVFFSNDQCKTFQQLADEHAMRLVLPADSKQYDRLILYGYKPFTD